MSTFAKWVTTKDSFYSQIQCFQCSISSKCFECVFRASRGEFAISMGDEWNAPIQFDQFYEDEFHCTDLFLFQLYFI